MTGYGQRLRDLRGDRTIESVAKETGISRSAVGMYEAEKRVPRDAVKIKLAEYYGMTVQELFFAS